MTALYRSGALAALRGRIAVVVLAALVLGGLLAQQTATRPGGRTHSFAMACMSERHPDWGQHGCADPAWGQVR